MSNSPASLPSTTTTVSDGGSSITNDNSPSSTIFIIIIIMASIILILALIFIVIRILHILHHRSTSSRIPVTRGRRDDRMNSNCYNNRNVSSPKSILDSLPLFTYNTVTGNHTGAGGDCAVCLSKFEGDDQLRLLPLCCHAFHARCIDTWLSSHMTCPLCRSSAYPTESHVINKIQGTTSNGINTDRSPSFRIEIGNVSNQPSSAAAVASSARRSYSIGEFEYIVSQGCEIPVDRTSAQQTSLPEVVVDDQKEVIGGGAPQVERLVEEAGRSSWLRDYIDRLGSLSFSTRTLSIRGSGRYFTGSSRRSEVVLAVEDVEAHRIGEEISEMFRWLSSA